MCIRDSTALGASLYQTADLGIAPYDYLSLGLRDYTPVPYFGCRVFTDALCALLCWLLGGLVGIFIIVMLPIGILTSYVLWKKGKIQVVDKEQK